jgi:hypothetical protein
LISLSVFQGKENDSIKHQLFRAEWADYNNDEEKHPQPHWHITANQAIEKIFEDFASEVDDRDFVSLLKEEKSRVIDVNQIHFAMNGNWMTINGSDVHPLNSEDQIIDWFRGLLTHIRKQLEYVKK